MLAESLGTLLAFFEKGQQRTWDYIPKRNCMWDTQIKKHKKYASIFFFCGNAKRCQVTNQSSHGELSFHHNLQLWLRRGLDLPTSRVIRRRGSRLKNAAHPTFCHCCELCALKQKPGVLLERKKSGGEGDFFSLLFFTHKSQLQTVLITASGPQA